MGAGAGAKHKYQEPLRVEVSPKRSKTLLGNIGCPNDVTHDDVTREAPPSKMKPIKIKPLKIPDAVLAQARSKIVERSHTNDAPSSVPTNSARSHKDDAPNPHLIQSSPRPAAPPFSVKRKTLTKADLQQIRSKRKDVLQTLQSEGFIPGAQELPATPQAQNLYLRRSRTQEEIEQEFPDLVDAGARGEEKVSLVQDMLLRTEHDPIRERRQIFRSLCFEWHPSRHAGTPSERWADHVYQFLMQHRDWYLSIGAEKKDRVTEDHLKEAMVPLSAR